MNFRAKGLVVAAVIASAAILAGGYYFFRSPLRSSLPNGIASAGPPTVSLEIKTAQGDQSLVIRWQDLAPATRELRVYRTKKGTNHWLFWKSVAVPRGSQSGSSAQLNGGASSFGGYSYYAQAVGGGGGGGGGGSGTNPPQEVLWTSPPADPPISTSTPPASPAPMPPPPPSGEVSSPPIPTFQVSHSNNLVEITWQDLPAATTFLVISRSRNPGGPWGTFFTETNPVTTGPFTERITDTTPATSYYYEITVYHDMTPLDTYGPIYVSAL